MIAYILKEKCDFKIQKKTPSFDPLVKKKYINIQISVHYQSLLPNSLPILFSKSIILYNYLYNRTFPILR